MTETEKKTRTILPLAERIKRDEGRILQMRERQREEVVKGVIDELGALEDLQHRAAQAGLLEVVDAVAKARAALNVTGEPGTRTLRKA